MCNPPHADRDAAESPSPAVPGGYRVVRLAGRGTFCDVWRVATKTGGQAFALKQLRPEFADDPHVRELLKNEARVGRCVDGDFFPRVVECDETSASRPCIILEWLDGTTLSDELGESGRLPIGRAVWIARQCAQALACLHRTGYCHGDLKPSNVFICRDGWVKLLDLGFAQPLRGKSVPGEKRLLLGTPHYLAPEVLTQCRGQLASRDVYSLGVMTYRMLTGRLPFPGETVADVMRLQRQSRPPHLRRYCPDAPRELSDLIARLLAKQPLRRPQDMDRLVEQWMQLEIATLAERIGPATLGRGEQTRPHFAATAAESAAFEAVL